MWKRVYGLVLLVLCAALLAGCSGREAEEAAGGFAGLVINVDELSSEVSFIDYDAGGTAMQLLARVDASGTPRLSYNTCQSCNGSPYAYFEVVGERLVCRNCGNLFDFDSIGAKAAYGCLPIAVEAYEVTEGQVLVSAETLNGMKSAFANWKKGL